MNLDIDHVRMNVKITKQKKRNAKNKKAKILSYKCFAPTKDNEQYYLGCFLLGTSNNLIGSDWKFCQLRISSEEETDYLIVDVCDNTWIISLLADAPLIQNIIQTKIFSLKFTQNKDQVTISLYLTKLPINYTAKITNTIKDVFEVLFNITTNQNKFLPEDNSTKYKQTLNENIPELYQNIRKLQDTSKLNNFEINSPYLVPTLRKYQKDAVRWMIQQEKRTEIKILDHPAYIPIKLPTNLVLYYNKYLGLIESEKPTSKHQRAGGILADEMGLGKSVEILSLILHNQKYLGDVNEGPVILRHPRKRKLKPQDEIAKITKKIKISSEFVKGKKSQTRQALELFYNNSLLLVCNQRNEFEKKALDKDCDQNVLCVCGSKKKKGSVKCVDCDKRQHEKCMGFEKDFGEYRCPQCWKKQPLLESKATLIVCPTSLRKQWSKEICKHIKGGLKIFHYEGSSATPVYPTKLQNFDIVITTYNVLQSEFKLAEHCQVKTFRNESKYAIPGSPIRMISWFRLCLDEAQAVESSTNKVSEMAQKLIAKYRWAITGTPISKGISDLFGLVDYLHFEPYSDLETWESCLYKPYLEGNQAPLLNFLSEILWRTEKKDVLDQINIPLQTTLHHFVEFSAVERYFYDRENEAMSSTFIQTLKKHDLNKPLRYMQKSTLKSLFKPFLCLRKLCVQPATVKGRYLVTRKPVKSMEELLEALIAKNIADSEEYLRMLISAQNGLAGIYLLQENPAQAVVEYRKALQLVASLSEDKADDIKLSADNLQLIHTYYNLAEILENFTHFDPTLRDDKLREQCQELEMKYIQRFNKQIVGTIQSMTKYCDEISSQQEELKLGQGQWYTAILEYIAANGLIKELFVKVDSFLSRNDYNQYAFQKMNDKQLLYTLKTWEDEIHGLREETIEAINDLYTIQEGKVLTKKELVKAAADCHLRPGKGGKKKKKKCPICEANRSLVEYESQLFHMEKKMNVHADTINSGSWKPTEKEQLLKVLLNFGRSKCLEEDVIADGEIYVNIYDTYKKEFKEVRKMWTYLDSQVCANDEIEICKIRLTLKPAEETETSEEPKKNNALKNLSYAIVNRIENINELDKHELEYQKANIESESVESLVSLKKCIGTHKYLKTLHHQQNTGQSPDPCPICKCTLDKKWNILICGHCYCLECMQVLLGQMPGKYITCPICRDKQKVEDINYIEMRDQAKEVEEVKVLGNCSTKSQAIIRLIFQLTQENPTVKILVFSNWPDVLNLLKTDFHKNSITSEILSTNKLQKILDKFQDANGNLTALLLPIKLGAKGLNLIEATHVIFADPVLDPASILQAIGRVHRIGQTKPTTVHHFLIKNSIEENIHSSTSTNADKWQANKVTLKEIQTLFVGDSEGGSNEGGVEVAEEMVEENEGDTAQEDGESSDEEADENVPTLDEVLNAMDDEDLDEEEDETDED